MLAVVLLSSGCAWITRASVNTTGGDPNGESRFPSMSADGRYVAFSSRASNLLPTDGNRREDVFVRDLLSGRTTRASIDTAGGGPDGDSVDPSISADGRYVVFTSAATDLVPGDANNVRDVFVRDMQARSTTRVSVTTTGGDPDGSSGHASISADGRTVAFDSLASDLELVSDTDATVDVFVRDLETATTTRVSVTTTGGDPVGSASFLPSISGDGRYVAFQSDASDLVPGDGNGSGDVFVRDLQTAVTTRASVDSTGDDADDWSTTPSISGDGRYVAFQSLASDLVPGDGNDVSDVFVRDMVAHTTTRVSVDTTGADPDALSDDPTISGDGRYVAFQSFAGDLVSDDATSTLDVFVRDLQTNITRRVSVDTIGNQADGESYAPSISADGRYVAFWSRSSNLVPGGDGNPYLSDIYVRFVVTPRIDSVIPATVDQGATVTVRLTGDGFLPGAVVSASLFSGPGVAVNSVSRVSETELDVSMKIEADAPTGPRGVTVINPGTGPGALEGSYGICGGCLTVN